VILENLCNRLQHTDPLQRLNAVIVLGTVDEVEALSNVVAAFKVEPEADVRQAMAWSGKRLQAAKQSNYSTLNEIFRHFRIELSVSAETDERERRLLEQMKFKAEMESQQRQQDGIKGAAATAVVSTALFGFTGMMAGMGGATPSGAAFISSNIGENGPKLGSQRIMPTRPTEADIRQYVRRLKEDPDPNKRAGAAHNLARVVNNLDALPELATAFIDDPKSTVKEAAQAAAKEIYWNAVYWEMEQDGRMKAEIQKRTGETAQTTAAGTATPSQSVPATAPPKPSSKEISDILKKAEAQRQKRKRF